MVIRSQSLEEVGNWTEPKYGRGQIVGYYPHHYQQTHRIGIMQIDRIRFIRARHNDRSRDQVPHLYYGVLFLK